MRYSYDRRARDTVSPRPTVVVPGPHAVETTDDDMLLAAMSVQTEAEGLSRLIPHGSKTQIIHTIRTIEQQLKDLRAQLWRWADRK